MQTTRQRALDAALDLVGEEGIRALTHARVDERADLPKGSTSNWFRTRAALVAGVIAWLLEREQADLAGSAAPAIDTADDLIDALTGMITAQTGPFAARTRARYALFLEATGDPDLLAPLRTQREDFVAWTTALLARVGARAPEEAVRTLMAAADGLVLHRVTVDPDAAVRPVIERTVRACLR
ncbi:MAG: TetR family transcriptional regulator [Candidatus Cloacimonetes bacterium]|nr:TetR family transcriptional regulator [Candidatus Cloacimonadota bacterium]